MLVRAPNLTNSFANMRVPWDLPQVVYQANAALRFRHVVTLVVQQTEVRQRGHCRRGLTATVSRHDPVPGQRNDPVSILALPFGHAPVNCLHPHESSGVQQNGMLLRRAQVLEQNVFELRRPQPYQQVRTVQLGHSIGMWNGE